MSATEADATDVGLNVLGLPYLRLAEIQGLQPEDEYDSMAGILAGSD